MDGIDGTIGVLFTDSSGQLKNRRFGPLPNIEEIHPHAFNARGTLISAKRPMANVGFEESELATGGH